MRKFGFSLIELLFAIMISGMLSVMLFGTFFQANRFAQRVDDFADIYTSAAIVQHQLERDIQGVFIPARVFARRKEEKQSKTKQEKSTEQPTTSTYKGEKKKPLKKVFYAVNRNDMLHELTFITSNPLQVYWSAHVGQAKPRVARVRYLMVEDKERKERYSLMRQESHELDAQEFRPDAKKPVHAYAVAENVKQLSAEYLFIKEKDNEKEKRDKAEKEYKTFKDWNVEKGADDEKTKDQYDKMVPQFVRFTLTLWDDNQERDESFTFTVPVLAHVAQLTERKTPKDDANKKTPSAAQQKHNDRLASLRRRSRRRRPMVARGKGVRRRRTRPA